MRFISTAVIGIDPLPDLLCTEQSIGFDDRPFPVYPLGLNRIQPGAFTRQATRQDAYPMPSLLHLAVVLPQPGTHLVADVPRRVVPDQQHCSEPLCRQPRAAPGEKGGGLGADRTALHK